MLRIGLTGELGTGKSTVACLLAARGAHIFSSDEMGRALMQRGEQVYEAIVAQFGPGVLRPDGTLDRPALAALAFDPTRPRVEELNSLVHPAVIAAQEHAIAALAETDPEGIAVVESALLLTTRHAGAPDPWHTRFDEVVLVTAPDSVKLHRAVARASQGRQLAPAERLALQIDTERRLAAQRIPPALGERCLLLDNASDLPALERRVDELWQHLQARTRAVRGTHAN